MKPDNNIPNHDPQQDDAENERISESPFPASLLELDALRAMLGLLQEAKAPRPDAPEKPNK